MIRALAVSAAAAALAALAPAAPVAASPNCTEIAGHHAYLCLYAHIPGHGTGYFTDLLENNWLYVNPAGSGGLMQVQETFIKAGAPGATHDTPNRSFGLADGVVITDAAWLAAPSATSPPRWCTTPGDPPVTAACTDAEQQAAMNFWATATAEHIGHSF